MPAILTIFFLMITFSAFAGTEGSALSARSQLDSVGQKPLVLVVKKECITEDRSRNVASARVVEYEDWSGSHKLHEQNALKGNFSSVVFKVEGKEELIDLFSSLGKNLIVYLNTSQDWVFNCYGFVAFMNGYDSSIGEMDLDSAEIENLNTLQAGQTVRIGCKTGKDFIPYHYAIYLGQGLFLSKMGAGGKLLVHDEETIRKLYENRVSFQIVFMKSSGDQSEISA